MLYQDYNTKLLILAKQLHDNAVLTAPALKILNDLLNKLLFKLLDNQYNLDNYISKLVSCDRDMAASWSINKNIEMSSLVFADSVGWMKLNAGSQELVCRFAEYVLAEILVDSLKIAEMKFCETLEEKEQELDEDAYDAYLDEHPIICEVTESILQSVLEREPILSIVNAL